jgi:hypothetical protein
MPTQPKAPAPPPPEVPLDKTTALIDYEGRDNGAGRAK